MKTITEKKKGMVCEKRKHMNREIKRALAFFFLQLKRGWAPQDAMSQVEGHYGFIIKESVFYYLNQNLNRGGV